MKPDFTISKELLRDLTTFEVVAEQKSFTRAAAVLGLSVSALSQTMRRLEEALKTQLLQRTTRSVSVTSAGERLLLKLRPALASVGDAVRELRAAEGQLTGTLRINTTRLARHALAPVLVAFQQQHPEVIVEIVADDSLTDIVAQRFDAGVRLGESLERDMVALQLGGLQGCFVASPEYLSERGVPAHPRDLLEHTCIALGEPTRGVRIPWRFEKGRKVIEIAPKGSLVMNDADLALEAARLGAGIALTTVAMASGELDRGTLERVLEPWTPATLGVFLYYPSRGHRSPPLRAFIDIVKERRRAR